MFEKVRLQLIISYAIVLSVILGTFAICVRVIFTLNLSRQQLIRLETLARSAALEIEIEDDGEIEVDDEIIVGANQGVQWFDKEGNLISEQGDYVLKLPFEPTTMIQTQRIPYPAQGLIIPVNDEDTGIFIGYARVSESREEIQRLLQRLDWGLGGGIVISLLLSVSGGFWLLGQATRPIQESFHKLQQFTSDAAHELRSPLMAISANAGVALKYSEGMRSLDREKFTAIMSASQQLTHLTEALLFLARSDQKFSSDHEMMNLTGLIQELIALYQPLANDQNIQLTEQCQKQFWVKGDRVQLTRLFVNLLDNALRYTPAGGQVTIKATADQTQLQVTVEDTGIGISPQQIEKVFDRFWQADQSRSYQSKGFGLGLSIAQEIAKNHQGSIMVSSKLGEGSCFTVALPLLEQLQEETGQSSALKRYPTP